MDVAGLFATSLNPLELVLRGSVMYVFLFLLFRFALRRDGGSLGIADVLLVVVIADASQNAMAGEYRTITDGIILVATIAAWNWVMDWATFRFPRLRGFLDAPPVTLVRRGQLMRREMRRELITVPELMARLREHGIEKLAEVKIARLEGTGDITVIRE